MYIKIKLYSCTRSFKPTSLRFSSASPIAPPLAMLSAAFYDDYALGSPWNICCAMLGSRLLGYEGAKFGYFNGVNLAPGTL